MTGSRIDFASVGINPPAFDTRSIGTKICVWSNVDASNVDYAIGMKLVILGSPYLIQAQQVASNGMLELHRLQG